MTLTFAAAPRISLREWTAVLTRFNSPVVPVAAECYGICVSAGIDPCVALAFFGKESTFGTRGRSVQWRSWGNMRVAQVLDLANPPVPGLNFATYPSWQNSLKDWVAHIKNRYVMRGLNDVMQAIAVYAPAFENNVDEYRQFVQTHVDQWMSEDKPMAGDGWYPGATRVTKGVGFWSGNKGRKAIVNHVVVGSAQSALNEFAKGGVSAHFVFAQNGDVYQCVSIFDSAWANGLSWINGKWQDPEGSFVNPPWTGLEPGVNPNWYTVSMEHEGQSGDPWSAAMTASNNKVTAWVADQCAIHIAAHETLIGHNEISPVNRAHCPGSGCDLFAIAAAVNSPTPKPVGPPGTFPVDPALKAYYDKSGGLWQPDRYCLGYALSPLTSGIQRFERGALRLRPDGGIDALLRSEW